jgi:drug/metabolite transporter (DMT)-like permease
MKSRLNRFEPWDLSIMADQRPWLGIGLALVAASTFALNSTLARIAYDGGTDALSVLTARGIFAVVPLFVFLRVRGAMLALPWRRRWPAYGIGVLISAYSFCLFKAIGYMPVALAVLTFYTYPLLTGLGAWATGQDRLGAPAVGALVVACIGLALALDVRGEGFDAVGTVLAIMAALTVTLVIMLSARLTRGTDSRPMTLHMLVSAAVTYLAACSLSGGFVAPVTGAGWAATGGVLLFYAVGVVAFFSAVAAVGPIRATLVMNFEPVAALFLGAAVLEQHLSAWQLFGAALVIGAVVMVRVWLGRQPAPAAEPPS